MSETVTRADTLTKSRIAKQPAPNSAEFQFPQFDVPKMEIPEALRDVVTKWIHQGKDNFEKAIKATEEINGTYETVCSTVTKGAMICGAKVTEATHTNTVAVFDIAHDLMAAKSLPEVIEISTTGARKQFEALAAQNHELWTRTQQLVTETIRPIAGGLPKVFNAGAPTK